MKVAHIENTIPLLCGGCDVCTKCIGGNLYGPIIYYPPAPRNHLFQERQKGFDACKTTTQFALRRESFSCPLTHTILRSLRSGHFQSFLPSTHTKFQIAAETSVCMGRQKGGNCGAERRKEINSKKIKKILKKDLHFQKDCVTMTKLSGGQ